jgi:superfamily II DNA or RNA helicase
MSNILPKAGLVPVVYGKSPTSLKWHQADAIKALNVKVQTQPRFAGLLVMPTGSGKTITAAYWLLQNVINRHKKLLWIAHRHELLIQALQTFIRNACDDLVSDRRSFQYRIISGLPDLYFPLTRNS